MVGAWERFWFSSTPASTLALVRIAFGLVVLGWALSLAPELALLFGPEGLVAGDRSYLVVWGMLLAGAACMTVGYRTRIASVVVFAALLWFDQVNHWALNSGDAVLRHLSFVLMLTPCGAALSPLPDLLTSSPVAAHVLTWGTIAVEAAIALLVWNRALRPWVLGVGICFHLAIDFSLRAGFFSWTMLVCYLAFVPPERATRLIERASQAYDPTSFFRLNQDIEP